MFVSEMLITKPIFGAQKSDTVLAGLLQYFPGREEGCSDLGKGFKCSQ